MEEKKTIKNVSRRGFITKSTLAAFGSLLGAKMVFGENFPKDIEPVGLQEASKNTIERKHKDLIVMHSDGISSTSEMSDFLTVNSFSSRLLAKKTVLKFGSDFDDASCIISKCISE